MNVAIHPLHGINLFAGVGMLDEGLRAGIEYMGIPYRTVCHVEREAYAASVLVARMEEGSMDAAPVWSDVTTFDATAWRGKVDCIVAGFPCQDLSVAGKRTGLDGKRSGLFFEVTRIADDSDAWLILLENVGGIASATASVVDETEGELDERAAARVVGELADLGWDSEWVTISASDVGASHGRARWFCVAWKLADTRSARPQGSQLRRACNCNGGGQETHGSTSELCGLFAPGPSDPRWADIIREFPHLAPALGGKLNPMFAEFLMGWPIGWTDSEVKLENIDAYRESIAKKLRVLLGTTEEEALQRKIGGFRNIQETTLLQSGLHGCCDVKRRSVEKCLCKTCAQSCPKGGVREMFYNREVVNSPQRQELEKQQCGEFADPMQFVSYVASSCARGHLSSATEAAMQIMRKGKLSEWIMQHLSDTDSAEWDSTCDETRAGIIVNAAISVHASRNRAARLKCIGNGVVASQAAVAFIILARRAGLFGGAR